MVKGSFKGKGPLDLRPLRSDVRDVSASIWVVPEAMKRVFDQDLFTEELPDSMPAAAEIAKLALDS